MIPRAQQAHELYSRSFGAMAVPYTQVLMAQRNWFQLRDEYLAALGRGWKAAIEIQSLLVAE